MSRGSTDTCPTWKVIAYLSTVKAFEESDGDTLKTLCNTFEVDVITECIRHLFDDDCTVNITDDLHQLCMVRTFNTLKCESIKSLLTCISQLDGYREYIIIELISNLIRHEKSIDIIGSLISISTDISSVLTTIILDCTNTPTNMPYIKSVLDMVGVKCGSDFTWDWLDLDNIVDLCDCDEYDFSKVDVLLESQEYVTLILDEIYDKSYKQGDPNYVDRFILIKEELSNYTGESECILDKIRSLTDDRYGIYYYQSDSLFKVTLFDKTKVHTNVCYCW